jgi:hypothetical protein
MPSTCLYCADALTPSHPARVRQESGKSSEAHRSDACLVGEVSTGGDHLEVVQTHSRHGVFGEEWQDGSGDLLGLAGTCWDLLGVLDVGFGQNQDDSSVCRERELECPLDPLRVPRLRCQDNREDIPAPNSSSIARTRCSLPRKPLSSNHTLYPSPCRALTNA